jgi:hypothetical protein
MSGCMELDGGHPDIEAFRIGEGGDGMGAWGVELRMGCQCDWVLGDGWDAVFLRVWICAGVFWLYR